MPPRLKATLIVTAFVVAGLMSWAGWSIGQALLRFDQSRGWVQGEGWTRRPQRTP
ncbi:hypothetical protein [Synechococcus sp. Cruz-7B9]|uniref:hypothetical protein n=1 Tax=Synechococcus sp. Cruz-7B9 TaxID=2823729 RepID=UPI0020D112CA|nr:hypothetical protein [Synechococcus sp. Cruz-7B9]